MPAATQRALNASATSFNPSTVLVRIASKVSTAFGRSTRDLVGRARRVAEHSGSLAERQDTPALSGVLTSDPD